MIIIGILIALSINNWNKERVVVLSKAKHIESLQAEATDNIRATSSTVRERERQVMLMEKLIATASRTVDDDTVRLAIDELLRQNLFAITSSAYDNLSASGNLGYIESDSILKLFRGIKQLQSEARTIQDRDASFITNQLEPYLTKRQVIYLLEIQTSDNRADLTISNQQTGRILKTLLQDRTFIDLIYLRMNRIKETLEATDAIRQELAQLVRELELVQAQSEK